MNRLNTSRKYSLRYIKHFPLHGQPKKTMANSENTGVHLKNMPTYYVKYGKEEDGIIELVRLKH